MKNKFFLILLIVFEITFSQEKKMDCATTIILN